MLENSKALYFLRPRFFTNERLDIRLGKILRNILRIFEIMRQDLAKFYRHV